MPRTISFTTTSIGMSFHAPVWSFQIRIEAGWAITPSMSGVLKKVGWALPTVTPVGATSSRKVSHSAQTPALLAG